MGKKIQAPVAPKYKKEEALFVIEEEERATIDFVDFPAVSYIIGIIAAIMGIGVIAKIARIFL